MTKQEELELKRELKEAKDKIKALKQTIFDMHKEQDEEKIKLQDMVLELQHGIEINDINYESVIAALKEDLSMCNLEIDRCKEEIYKNEVKIQKQREKIQSLNDQNGKLYLSKKYIKKCSELNHEKKKREQIERILRGHISNGEMDAYKREEWLIADAIKYLDSKLNTRTIHLYHLEEINRSISELRSVSIKDKPKNRMSRHYSKKHIFGTINEELKFLDYNGKEYNISEFVHGDVSNYIDYPCKAYLFKNNSVAIDKVYTKNKSMFKVDKKAIKNKEKTKRRCKPAYDKELNVLVVGSYNKEKYCTAISSYGLRYTWFDSFVNSPARLKDLYKSCDIAILLKDHMSHSVLGIIDTNNSNVAILGKDTESSVVSTMNYLINKNNLANIVVEDSGRI